MGVQDDYDPSKPFVPPEIGSQEDDMFMASGAELRARAEGNDAFAQLARDELERRKMKRSAQKEGTDLRSVRQAKQGKPLTDEDVQDMLEYLKPYGRKGKGEQGQVCPHCGR